MTDAFEKNIREKLRNHSMPVDERLWTDIGRTMKERSRWRRIRMAAAWTAALSAAAMLCVAFLLPEQHIAPASDTAAVMNNAGKERLHAEQTVATALLADSHKALREKKTIGSIAAANESGKEGQRTEYKEQRILRVSESRDELAKSLPSSSRIGEANKEQSAEDRGQRIEEREQRILRVIESRDEPAQSLPSSSRIGEANKGQSAENRVQSKPEATHTTATYLGGKEYEEQKNGSKNALQLSLYAYGPTNTRNGKDFRLTMSNTTFSCLNTQNMNMDAVTGMHKQMHADHKMPIKFGVSARYNLGSGLGIESGLRYTLLQSSFTNITNTQSYDQRIHMLGIPLNLTYDIASIGNLAFYTSLGGEVAHCVSVESEVRNSTSHPWQISLNAAVGMQYALGSNIGIYVEPGVAHHLNNGSSLETAYTEHPTDFSLLVGIRMNLRK